MAPRIAIPREVLMSTTQCPHDFSCLESTHCGDFRTCRVESFPANKVIFVAARVEAADCPYRITFGYGHVCRCPTLAALLRLKNSPVIIAPPPPKGRITERGF